jgi:hypothetical protein
MNINDKHHYTKVLRNVLLHRTSSSVLTDCTLNMPSEGIYRLPSEDAVSTQIIHLVERTFQKELYALKQTANKIRRNLTQSSNSLGDYALAKLHDGFSTPIRLLIASQLSIKEINIMAATSLSNENNGGSYVYYDTIKYYRSDRDSTINSAADYDSIHDVKLKQNFNVILQSFTPSNARETLKQTTNNNSLFNDGWWIGPVLCEKNKNETFMMAHIFPLTNR